MCEPAEPCARGRSRTRRALAAGAAALFLPLAAAAPGAAGTPADSTRGGRVDLQQAFADAAERYRVPREVLLGVSYLQSRWDTHAGRPSVSGGYGPMHLTDVRTALRESEPEAAARAGRPPARLLTLARAAELTGHSPAELRERPAANIEGGAALLAEAQRDLGLPLSDDPADWYRAVAAFPGGGDTGTAAGDEGARGAAFAREVFSVLREGAERVTDTGGPVTLAAAPGLRTDGPSTDTETDTGGDTSAGAGTDTAPECPPALDCVWLPAPHERFTDDEGEPDYGNHDKARRPDGPESPDIDYVVIHDVEGYWEGATQQVRDPESVSWHYTLRSTDGHVAQHLRTRDVGWHSGNWYINSTSVGLEHEGFLTSPDAWYTEAMYRASARLVAYLARRYDIPLDRQHILGHDNVPGATSATVPGMHTDPGPYWDWQHYFRLLGAPLDAASAGPGAPLVTIRPDYRTHRPRYTGCAKDGTPCPAHGSGAVRLHTAPDAAAPLVRDRGLRPGGGPSTDGVNDTGARASTGQQYAAAGREGDWTAIWYLGEKAWFHNPDDRPTAVPADGAFVTPAEGPAGAAGAEGGVPVYGRAYPEESAYPDGVPAQSIEPLPYRIKAGQRYALGLRTRGSYLWAKSFDPRGEKSRLVRGRELYYQIQLGHRVAFVRADDVTVHGPGADDAAEGGGAAEQAEAPTAAGTTPPEAA